MGKQGPCYHCGVTSTPLWRNGPPEKPVLCNACGSRWRTKGTLANYTPLHSRADADEFEDQRVSKVKAISFKVGDEKLKKRKLNYENSARKRLASDYQQVFPRTTDEDTSNRSSSGSALSNSESFAQLSSADASDFTGPSQSAVWENQVPSKKRTSMTRTKSSSLVEKLIKDLRAILHEQKSSYLSGSSEEDLLFESDAPMLSVEIGHGSVLIKHPSWLVRQENSEASSLTFEHKPCTSNEAYSHSVSLSGSNGFKGGNAAKFTGKVMQQEPAKRDNKFNLDKMKHFLTNNSPLCYIDLKDVINFEVLLGHFTSDEQQQLLKYLPPDDASELPGSLRNMFDSSCFKENITFFQQLLSDGVFSKAEDFKALKKLLVCNSTKSKMFGLKDSRSSNHAQEFEVKSASELGSSKDLQSAKRPLQEQNLNMPSKETTEGPKRGLAKSGLGSKEPWDRDGAFFTPGSLFRLPTDGCCIRLESCDECSDQDLLLDVPSYGSFPEAELLLPPSSITIPSHHC